MSTDTSRDTFTGRVVAIGTDTILIVTADGLRVEAQTFNGLRHVELGNVVTVKGLPISLDVLLANSTVTNALAGRALVTPGEDTTS